MRRAVLTILGVAAAITALILVVAAIAVATVDPRSLVAPVLSRIKAVTGRELTIAGPVELKLSLAPKIVVGGVRFANAKWASTPDMLQAKRIEARIALLPLLHRQFNVVELALVDPVIALETDANGRGNWEFGPARQPPAGASATAEAPGAASAIAAFGIANLVVDSGEISFHDGASGSTTRITVDQLALHARDFTTPMAVDLRGVVDGVPVVLSGNVGPAKEWLSPRGSYPIALGGTVGGTAAKLSTKLARSGATTSFGDLSLDWGAVAAHGSVRATTVGGQAHYDVTLDVPTLSLAAGSPAEHAPSASSGKGAGRQWLFPDTPLPLAGLASLNADGRVTIGEVVLRGGQRVLGLDLSFTAHNGKLDLKGSSAAALGGSLEVAVTGGAGRSGAPALRLRLAATGIDLAALAAATGNARGIRGGTVRANVDLTGSGATAHAFASSMNGNVLAVAGPATLPVPAGGGESTLAQISRLVDPLRSAGGATQLRCAVVRLPLAGGIARVDRSIGVETGELSVIASGTIDFRDETLDLALESRIAKGVSIDVAGIASLLRVRGPFTHPSVGIDAAQSAQAIARIGLSQATGTGLVMLGQALVKSATAAAPACDVAMGKGTQRVPATAEERVPASASAGNVLPAEVGKALGSLFGH